MTAISSVTIVMTGKEAGLFKKFVQLQQEEKKSEKGMNDITAASKKLEREGVQTFEKLRTEAEKFRRKQDAIDAAVKRGTLSIEQGKTATRRLAQQYREAGQAGKRAFGAKALSGVKSLAAGFGLGAGLAGVIGLAKSAMTSLKEESDLAVTSMRALVKERIRLNQVSLSAKDLQELNKKADSRAVRFGIPRDVVRRIQFSAKSEGFEPSVEHILRGKQIVDPESAASVAGQVPALFPGQGLTPEEAINILLKGAQFSRVDFESVARTLPSVAEGGALTGATPSGAVASLAVLVKRFKKAETAADRLKALGTKLSLDPRTKGKGLIGGVEALQDFSPEELRKFLGESRELNVALTVFIQELDEIRKLRSILVRERGLTGTPESAFQRGIARAKADPTFQAANKVITSEIGLEVAREDQLAQGGAARQAAVNAARTRLNRSGASGAGRFAGGAAAEAAGFFDAPPGTIVAAGRVGEGLPAAVANSLGNVLLSSVPGIENLIGVLSRTADAVERQNQLLESESGQGLALEVSER